MPACRRGWTKTCQLSLWVCILDTVDVVWCSLGMTTNCRSFCFYLRTVLNLTRELMWLSFWRTFTIYIQGLWAYSLELTYFLKLKWQNVFFNRHLEWCIHIFSFLTGRRRTSVTAASLKLCWSDISCDRLRVSGTFKGTFLVLKNNNTTSLWPSGWK